MLCLAFVLAVDFHHSALSMDQIMRGVQARNSMHDRYKSINNTFCTRVLVGVNVFLLLLLCWLYLYLVSVSHIRVRTTHDDCANVFAANADRREKPSPTLRRRILDVVARARASASRRRITYAKRTHLQSTSPYTYEYHVCHAYTQHSSLSVAPHNTQRASSSSSCAHHSRGKYTLAPGVPVVRCTTQADRLKYTYKCNICTCICTYKLLPCIVERSSPNTLSIAFVQKQQRNIIRFPLNHRQWLFSLYIYLRCYRTHYSLRFVLHFLWERENPARYLTTLDGRSRVTREGGSGNVNVGYAQRSRDERTIQYTQKTHILSRCRRFVVVVVIA